MSSILEYWEGKLQSWGVYRASGSRFGGVSSAYDGTFNDTAPRPPLPPIGEVQDTDAIVVKLAIDLQESLIAVYVWSVPERFEERARLLRIHPNTLRERIKQAKFRLDDLDQARKYAMQRARPLLRFGCA